MTKKLRFVASVILLGFLAWHTDWHQVREAFARLDLRLWLLGVALYAVTQVVSSLRWALLARPLGFDRRLGDYLAFYYVGMFFNLVLPTSVGGDVVRAWYLDGRSGRRLPAFLSVLLDRGSGLLVLLLIACVAAALSPIALPRGLAAGVWAAGALAVVGLAFLALTAGRIAGPIGRLLGARVGRLISSIDDLKTIFWSRRGLLVSTTLLSVVVQAANVVLVWLIGHALGAPVPAAYYAVLVPVVTLLTLLPVSLNGMGVREGAMVLLLAPFGITEGTALSLAFLWFLTFTAVSLLGVGFYLFGGFPRFEVRGDDDPVDRGSDQGREGQLEAAA